MSNTNPDMQQKTSAEIAEVHEISIQEIIQIVLRRKWGILTIILVSLIGAIIFNFSQTPSYYAEAVLMINKPQSGPNIVDAVLGIDTNSDSQYAKKDIELIKSIPVSEMTVKELWNSSQRDSLELFGNRPYVSPVKQIFQWIIPVKKDSDKDQRITKGTPLYDSTMRYYALILNNRIRVKGSRETSIINVSVESPFADEAVTLTNFLCGLYKRLDIKRNSERYVQSNRYVSEMLKDQERQLANADAALSRYMVENNIFEVTGGTMDLLARLLEIDSKYNQILSEYRITLNSRDFLKKKLSESENELSNRISRTVDKQLSSINEEIRTKESQYINLLRTKSVTDSEVQSLRKQIEQIKSRYEQLSRSNIAGQISYIGQSQKYRYDIVSEKLELERKLDNLNFTASEYKKLKNYYESKLDALPNKEQNFVRLQRERDVVSKTYLFLKEKLDETRILIGSEVGNISIIGSAFKPFNPDGPDYVKNLIFGFVLGLVVSGFYAFAAEKLDDRINYDPLFFKSLGFDIWGIVPLIPSFNTRVDEGTIAHMFNRLIDNFNSITGKKKELKGAPPENPEKTVMDESYPMMTDKLNSSFAESFRTLRTNLAFARIDQSLKTVLISGCTIGEGKSTIGSNLAMAWALADKKTLIIDADLRRPAQHKIFKKTRALGLADCLVNNDLEINDRYINKTHIDNLYLLSAGSPVPNPNELLGSDRMKSLLANLAQQYERIIIDSPPVFISDAAQLIGMVDGALITVRLGYSSKYTLKQYAYDSFIHSHIVGIVVIDNERPTKGLGNQGYGRYGYTRYGYGEYGNAYPDKHS